MELLKELADGIKQFDIEDTSYIELEISYDDICYLYQLVKNDQECNLK